MKPSTRGTGTKLKQWTQEEDNALKTLFYRYSQNFKQGKHGSTISRIKADLEKQGINRTVKAVNRRLSRLGFTFYKVHNDLIVLQCKECFKPFLAYGKVTKRKNHKQALCKICQSYKNREWDRTHNEEKKQYYKDYFRLFKMKGGIKEHAQRKTAKA